MFLISNKGCFTFVALIPTIKKFTANNPTNKIVLFTKFIKLNISGINVNMNKTTKLLDVELAIFFPSINLKYLYIII